MRRATRGPTDSGWRSRPRQAAAAARTSGSSWRSSGSDFAGESRTIRLPARPRGFRGRRAEWTSVSVRGRRAGPRSRLPHPRKRPAGPRERFGQRHHGVAGLAHRRAKVFVRGGLEPAAEILLLGQEVVECLGNGRMVARHADLEQRPDELAGRVDGTCTRPAIELIPAAVGVLKRARAGRSRA